AETIGIDAHQFNDTYEVSDSGPYPVIYGGEEEVRKVMLISPNEHARARQNDRRGQEIFNRYAGRILLPNRIWLDTAHVLALYSKEKTLSNLFYAVNLKGDCCVAERENCVAEREKALVAWLNSTWGLLTLLAERQETRGAFISHTLTQWRLQPVLDVCALDKDRVISLAAVFDKYASVDFGRILDQYRTFNKDRFDFDKFCARSTQGYRKTMPKPT
ncbi:MAG: hypothetical protein ACP5GH_07390, partial [Nitrososphaeria archaeon]